MDLVKIAEQIANRVTIEEAVEVIDYIREKMKG